MMHYDNNQKFRQKITLVNAMYLLSFDKNNQGITYLRCITNQFLSL